MRKRFDLDGSYPYYDILIDRFSGKNDSWRILWWYAVFSVKGLVLYPGKTLICNKGFDGTGTHCGKQNPDQEPLEEFLKPRRSEKIEFMC